MISELIIIILTWVYKAIGIAFLAVLGFLFIVYNIGKEAWQFNKTWYGIGSKKKTHKDETL